MTDREKEIMRQHDRLRLVILDEHMEQMDQVGAAEHLVAYYARLANRRYMIIDRARNLIRAMVPALAAGNKIEPSRVEKLAQWVEESWADGEPV